MARPMHIADTAKADLFDAGLAPNARALCGARIRTNGASKNAPYCETCARKAGWDRKKK
ncbi:hypothetical protein H0B56_03820 [Haloechinothrix sp. YIM 98757]|uniref:Uncharacterized protein n=1 Tax=Haloechinothrix aidingensis TaxID=2752311 RepID=A0A838A0N5_9PSEU|nr:hypothetical protein [Haloechinothrix aidingensis]MBA0124663.1 hypothetical protein [Haloechinothrix aidingensis]